MTRTHGKGEDDWKRAKNLEDLGELTALWLEGELRHNPSYASEPDEETDPLRTTLASCNRRGFFTTFSQPAEPLDQGAGFAQRASVEGYAREDLAKRLGSLGLWTDLLVFLLPPGEVGGYGVPITVDDFHPFTWLGARYVQNEFESLAEEYSPEALRDLQLTWSVAIIDPCWGRGPYLWEHVLAVLDGRATEERFSVEPAPHLGLDSDFVY